MSVYYTSEQLIASVKRRINIPTNQNTFTDSDILEFADEEMALGLVPAILTLHEDYLLFSDDVPMVQNQSEYVIPYRAVGNKLYDMQFIDTNNAILPMSRTTVSDEPNYNGFYTVNTTYAYDIMNNKIRLLPTVSGLTTGSLRFIYYIKPSSLVPTNQVGIITNINRTTGEITVNGIPTAFDPNQLYDFYKAKSPHNILTIDNAVLSINGTSKTLTFDTDLIPPRLDVGDHVSLAQQAAIPQVPSDLHVFLAQKTAERILESQGDLEGLKLAQAKSGEMEARASAIIDNRVDESPLKITNRHGILKSGLIQRLYRRRG